MVVDKKFVGKGKAGKYCPFRVDHKCGDYCGLYCIGLKACVFHAINLNLQKVKVISRN